MPPGPETFEEAKGEDESEAAEAEAEEEEGKLTKLKSGPVGDVRAVTKRLTEAAMVRGSPKGPKTD